MYIRRNTVYVTEMRTLVFLVIFASLFFSATLACGSDEYNNEGRCCKKCPKGYFVKKHCSLNVLQTICEPCESGTFAEDLNNDIQCKACFQGPCQKPRVDFKNTCNPTTDNRCECPVSNQFYAKSLDGCLPCDVCKAGEFPQSPCTSHTKCKKCKKGYFSNRTENFNLGCNKCTLCNNYKSRCNSTNDAICNDVSQQRTIVIPTTAGRTSKAMTTRKENAQGLNKEYDLHIIVTVIVFVIFFLCVFVFCVLRERKRAICSKGTRSSWFLKKDYETLNTGFLLRDQSASLILKLHEYLNPAILPNWKTLAAELGFDYMQIKNFEVNADTAAENMLAAWMTKDTATVDVLHKLLLQIGRSDVATYLRANLPSETESAETFV